MPLPGLFGIIFLARKVVSRLQTIMIEVQQLQTFRKWFDHLKIAALGSRLRPASTGWPAICDPLAKVSANYAFTQALYIVSISSSVAPS